MTFRDRIWGLLTMVLAAALALTAAGQPGKGGHATGGAFDDLPVGDATARSIPGLHEDAGKKIKENIYVEASFDRSTCFPFEQVRLTYKLYTALQSNSTVAAKPSLEGFISRELKAEEEPAEKVVGGKSYRVFNVWQVRLTALQPGSYTIGPLAVNNEVSYIAADGSVGRYKGAVSSNSAVLRVLTFPVSGQPAGFMGPVGKWAVSSRLTKNRPAMGERDTLVVEMAGQGSFEDLTVPGMRWPEGIIHYKPIEKWEVREDAYPQIGKKVFAIPFSGRIPGKYVLPPVALTYFDPGAGVYRTVQSDSLAMQVSGETARAVGGVVKAPDVKELRLLLLGLLIGLGLVAAVAAIMLRRRRPRLVAAPEPVVSPSEQLAGVETITDKEVYLTAMKQLLIDHLRAKLGIDGWGDPRAEEELMRLLAERDWSMARRIGGVLDQCNRLLYAPHSVDAEVRSELSSRVAGVLYGR